MDRNLYRFRSAWNLNAPRDDVFLALAELGDYPTWWPQVRAVRWVSDEARELTCRSTLPYDLTFTSRQTRRDRQGGILEAGLAGELQGFSRWTITSSSGGTHATFDQEVIVNKPLLRRLAPVARPAFKVNHAVMMRHGQRGLAAYLAGMRRGRESQTAGSAGGEGMPDEVNGGPSECQT